MLYAILTQRIFLFSAWAIKCYECKPDLSSLTTDNKKDCSDPTDTLDCSNSSLGNIVADSCLSLSVILAHPSVAHDVPFYYQNCGFKSLCTLLKNQLCGSLATLVNGTSTHIKGCDVTCCESDLCNKPAGSSGISITPTGAIFGTLGLMTVALMNLF